MGTFWAMKLGQLAASYRKLVEVREIQEYYQIFKSNLQNIPEIIKEKLQDHNIQLEVSQIVPQILLRHWFWFPSSLDAGTN